MKTLMNLISYVKNNLVIGGNNMEDEERQVANEVDSGRFECFVRDNKEDLVRRYLKLVEEDFDSFCRNDYEMFKDD